jgi:hypothetical protein
MQPTRLQIDTLIIESFTIDPVTGVQADEPNFMIAKCTGCPSGCGIIAQEPSIA